jgi:hypothetical protein
MAIFYNTNIIRNGLVLYLDAANVKSYPGTGTTWTDLSGNGNNGTLTNGPTYDSTNNGSIVFDGTNDYATTSVNFNNSNNFTINLWLKNTARGVSDGQILCIGNEKLLFYTAASTGSSPWVFSVYSPTIFNNTPRYSSLVMQLNQWYNLVGVYRGTSFEMLVNNVSILDLNTSISSYNIGVETIQMPRRILTGFTQFPGNIAQTSIYNRALTAAEITQNFNAQRGRYGI